jgi:hypothetical protein
VDDKEISVVMNSHVLLTDAKIKEIRPPYSNIKIIDFITFFHPIKLDQ